MEHVHHCSCSKYIIYQIEDGVPQKGMRCYYRRLHLPVNAPAKNMFSTDVKRLCFRCQTLKFPHPNLSLRDLKRLCFRYQTLKFRHISVIFAGFSHIL